MENLRVLQVLAGASEGGAETAYVDFCIALKEKGIDVIAATRKNQLRVKRLEEAGVPVHLFPFGSKIDFLTPLMLKRLILNEKPAIIQTWMSRAAAKIPAWKGKPEDKPYRVVSRLGGYYKLKYFSHTDYFVTITPQIMDYLVEKGVDASHVRHINNFAETENYNTPVKKSDFNTPENAPVLLTLSRLHNAKALDVLIRALKNLPEAYLWMAGDGPLRGNLENLAKNEGVFERVRFLGWRNDRAALLSAATICVFPSRYEPFGTTFIQAWANNTPLVCSDADGPKQFVRHGEDALMVPRDDVDALAGAIRQLLDDRILAAKIAENGYYRYRNEFTKDKTMQDYLTFYQDIMKNINIPDELIQKAVI